MLLERQNVALEPVENSMSNYPLTPPSSSEDSPVYMLADSNSTSFHIPGNFTGNAIIDILPQNQTAIDANMVVDNNRPYLQFIEEPTDRFRFRYKSEMAGTHGSLTGIKSDKSRKQTYPTVELKNFMGKAMIRCSIYQHNTHGQDFMPHAHRLIMKRGKEEQDDPHDLIVGPEDGWRATFHGMGIIHTAKKNIVSELLRKKNKLKEEYIARMEGRCRELTTAEKLEIKGLAEAESKSINLNIVCLRFDAFVKRDDILFPICPPLYSSGINNLKSALTGELRIVRLDHCSSPARGNKEIFILVERVTKRNIKIRFFEHDENGEEVWSDYGRFNDLDVHHQYAIVFKTPKYKDENITHPVKVFMELVRPTDNARSEPREFTYVPSCNKPGSKRPRHDWSSSSSSYNSSNIGSDELPEVISNLNLQNSMNMTTNTVNNSWNTTNILTSDELLVAMNNIDSDEFRRLFNHFEKGYQAVASTVVDAPASYEIAEHQMDTGTYQVSNAIKLEVLPEDKTMAIRAYDEMKSFIKTNPKQSSVVKWLNHYLDTDHKTNALHVFICLNNVDAVTFFLKLMWYTEFKLINIRNSYHQTPLQLAILSHNIMLVKYIMRSMAQVKVIDDKQNTALHTALEVNTSIDILEMLLQDRQHEKIRDFIDDMNNDGNTPLMMAIENKNLAAVKLLCMHGADINKQNNKNGFTALHLVIEKQYIDILRYILEVPNLDATIPDYNNITALTAAYKRESSRDIMDVIEKYIAEKSLIVDIKEEYEDESDEEMEDDSEIKSEPVSLQELEEMYRTVQSFTPACLEEVSEMLNCSGKWEDLAELLDVGSAIRAGLISPGPNISKNLLTFAVETNNDTVWEIRNFLENLDELQAVDRIDRMVRELHR